MKCSNCGNIEEYSGHDDSKIDYTCSTCVQRRIQPLSLGEKIRRITARNVATGLQLITGWDDRVPRDHKQDIKDSIMEEGK